MLLESPIDHCVIIAGWEEMDLVLFHSSTEICEVPENPQASEKRQWEYSIFIICSVPRTGWDILEDAEVNQIGNLLER